MKSILLLTLSLITLFSCNSDRPINSYALIKNSLPIPTDSSTRYFPLKTKDQDSTTNANSLDTFGNRWFSEMLFALHEPLLFKYTGNREIFRFTWLRSFHNPVTIRIEKQDNECLLFGKVTAGAGGYDPGPIKFDTIIVVSNHEWTNLLDKISEINFWKLPLEDPQGGSMDGAQWILEGIAQGKYHVIERQSPGRNNDYVKFCMYLLKLSGIKIKDEDQY